MAFRRFCAFGDSHGDLVCNDTVRALAKFIEHYKPHDRIHLGDVHDFRALRRGIGRDESDAFEDLETDKAKAREVLEILRPTVLLLGNHDHRLYRTAREHSSGLIRSACRAEADSFEKFCRQLHCKVVPYHFRDGFYRIGNLNFTHGYSANETSVRQHAAYYSHCQGSGLIMGHLHRYEEASAVKQGGARGWSAGCLADFEKMSYADHRMATSRWERAFCYGITNGTEFQVWAARKCAGKWILPTGVEEF